MNRKILGTVIGVAALATGIGILCAIDRRSGFFECPECGEKFVPDIKNYIMGPHVFSKRKLTCPNCGAREYCRKVSK